jgi:AbrB family looped-hinge helix DNA binding protein
MKPVIMEIVRLDDRGRISLPKELRDKMRWKTGQRFMLQFDGVTVTIERC